MVGQSLTASRRQSGLEALQEARSMLAQEEPDTAAAVPLLIHALGSRNLLVRSAAAEILTLLGKVAVPGMIARWPDADAERRRALLVLAGPGLEEALQHGGRGRVAELLETALHGGGSGTWRGHYSREKLSTRQAASSSRASSMTKRPSP